MDLQANRSTAVSGWWVGDRALPRAEPIVQSFRVQELCIGFALPGSSFQAQKIPKCDFLPGAVTEQNIQRVFGKKESCVVVAHLEGATYPVSRIKALTCWHRCGINLVAEGPLTQPDSSRPLPVLCLCRSGGGLVWRRHMGQFGISVNILAPDAKEITMRIETHRPRPWLGCALFGALLSPVVVAAPTLSTQILFDVTVTPPVNLPNLQQDFDDLS